MKRILALAGFIVFAVTNSANAAPVALSCPGGMQDKTSDPTITFGGSGIPTNAVCFGTFGDVTLGLTATARFANPAVTNDGLDTYFAGAGDDTANGQPSYAIWNFGWFVRNTSTSATYAIDLLWDTNPGAATDVSAMGHAMQLLSPGVTAQDSWNLGMGFIDTGVAIPGVYAPAAGLFSPYVGGQYSFALTATSGTGAPAGNIGMEVLVGDPVPEPATLVLLASGLAFVAFRQRRRRS